jgi:hypothetical protein
MQKNPIPVSINSAGLEEYLRLVVKHTPAPFTANSYDQMTLPPYGARMMLLDFPEAMASMAPPIDQIDYPFFHYIYGVMAEQGMTKGLKIFLWIVTAIVDLVATIYGGALGAAVAGIFTAVVQMCIAASQRLDGAITMAVSDIVGLVGSLLGAIADQMDLSSYLEDFTDKATGALDFAGLLEGLEGIAGIVKDEGIFDTIATVYQTVTEKLNWPYADTILASMQDSGAAIGLDRDSINTKMKNF